MLEDIALDIIKEQKFMDVPLFEMEDISDFYVTDDEGSMPLSEFLVEYTNRLMEVKNDK